MQKCHSDSSERTHNSCKVAMKMSYRSVSVACSMLLLLVVTVISVDNVKAGKVSSSLRRRELEKSPEDELALPALFIEETTHSQTLKTEDEGIVAVSAETIDPEDQGHRFAKFTMYDGKEKPNMQSTSAYPMSQEVSTLLRFHSNAYSVVTPQDYEMKHHDVTHYIDKVGGYPARPTTDLNGEYWDHFRFICQMQQLRREGKLPSDPKIWNPPELWANDDAYTVAERVHDEYPGENQAALLAHWFANGRRSIQLDSSILPFRCLEDFIGTEVRLAALNTWAITTVAPVNFAAKWHAGQLRPEEMAWKIASGEIAQENVPPDVYDMVTSMNLSKATDFTQYPEGSPKHPSWPAMHSAASSMSLWLPVIANLTEEQYCQVLLTDYAVSFARTVAGVHYRSDNMAGLNMGQEVVAHELPDHLAKVYGADPDAVKAKVEKFRFDWRNFDPETCGGATLVQPFPPLEPKPTPGGLVVNPGPRQGCTLKTVDFNDQPQGKYIKDEYAQYGLTLSARGGEGDLPRIFDTSNPGTQEEGDPDLGSPNYSCGGPGKGVGGEKGKPGENCIPLGNVLIIQEPGNGDMTIPDDNVEGGEMTLHFQGQYVKEIGLLDIDYKTKMVIEFNRSSGVTRRTVNVPLLGDNSYQVIDINIESVKSITLKLSRSGSVSFVSFCPIP